MRISCPSPSQEPSIDRSQLPDQRAETQAETQPLDTQGSQAGTAFWARLNAVRRISNSELASGEA
jgi:hypothetical protein